MEGVKVTKEDIQGEIRFLHNIISAKKNAQIKGLLENCSRKQSNLLIRMTILLVFNAHKCEKSVVDKLALKKKILLKTLKKKTGRKKLMKNVHLARAFLISIASAIPTIVHCFLK